MPDADTSGYWICGGERLPIVIGRCKVAPELPSQVPALSFVIGLAELNNGITINVNLDFGFETETNALKTRWHTMDISMRIALKLILTDSLLVVLFTALDLFCGIPWIKQVVWLPTTQGDQERIDDTRRYVRNLTNTWFITVPLLFMIYHVSKVIQLRQTPLSCPRYATIPAAGNCKSLCLGSKLVSLKTIADQYNVCATTRVSSRNHIQPYRRMVSHSGHWSIYFLRRAQLSWLN